MFRSIFNRLLPQQWLLALVAIGLFAFAACDSGSDTTPTLVAPSPEPTVAQPTATAVPPTEVPSAPTQVPATATTQPASTSSSTVSVRSAGDLGEVLVDSAGMTLYIFDRDTEGVSNCSGGCLTAWPPLLTTGSPTAGQGVQASLGTITRVDGTMQVTINGFPAYYWQADVNPGDTSGHGVNNVWWVFNADGTPQRPAKVGLAEDPELGTVLVDGAGMTLYIFDRDTEGVSNCSGGCLAAWPPLLTDYAPVGLRDVTAEIGMITRDDGTMQVTVNGMPVYYWQNDVSPGEALGQGRNGVWWVLDANGGAVGK